MLTPRVCVITVAFNEEYMLPQFIEHHLQFASKIHIIDGGSTDCSHKIIEKYGSSVELDIRPSDTLDDVSLLDIRNNTAAALSHEHYDWFAVVDVDEFIVGDVLPILHNCKEEVYRITPYHMVGDPSVVHEVFNPADCQTGLLDYQWGDKSVLFRSGIEPRYSIGCHSASPINSLDRRPATINMDRRLQVRHYQMYDLNQYLKKSALAAARLSARNKQHGYGVNRQRACTEEFHKYWNSSERVNVPMLYQSQTW